MSNHDVITSSEEKVPLRVTVTTIEIPIETARCLTNADELRRVIAPFVASDSLTPPPVLQRRPVRDLLGQWSPLRPFAGMLANYRVAREALGVDGKMSVIYISVAAGLASVLWRHDTIPIGVGGGLLVSGILFVRTGAYREYLAAIEETHGVPPLGAVLRYNVESLVHRIGALWQRF